MLELWHIAVKLLGQDEPEIVSITSNTLSGAMSVAAQSLAFKLLNSARICCWLFVKLAIPISPTTRTL